LQSTFVFQGTEVLGDAAVAVWVASEHPLGVTARHGWQPVGLPIMVTRVEGTVLHELAGRPAVDVFRENLQRELGMDEIGQLTKGYASQHALGLIEPDGTQLIRGIIVGDGGAVDTFTPVPAYSAVQIVFGCSEDVLSITDLAVKEALADRDAGLLLGFSCIARLDLLGDRGWEEASRLQAAAGTIPTFGFYTYGEFARTTSVAGYHNATIAAIAL
jgi:hypothetical protein